jgi:four helix bundle protein
MKTYQNLRVWQMGVDLVVLIYKITNSFPNAERFGLTSQIRRAAISIPANISEGYYRGHKQEYARFLKIAFASGGELETHLVIAEKLDFLQQENHRKITETLSQIMKMLHKLIKILESKS